jgi:hypothetical protein
MKTNPIVIAAILSLTAFGAARASGTEILKKIFPVVPSLAETARYWRNADLVIDKSVAFPAIHLVCGRVDYWGKYSILCVRAEIDGKLIQESYFKSEDHRDPTLEVEGDRFRIVMPTGFVLLEVFKKPNQSPQSPQAPQALGPRG